MELRRAPNRSWLIQAITPRLLLTIALLILHCETQKNAVNAVRSDFGMQSKNVRLRAPKSFEELVKELQAEPKNGLIRLEEPEEPVEVGPFFGNAEMVPLNETTERRKKACGMSSVSARAIIGPSLKRTYFAATEEEMMRKQEEENQQKRDVKRSDFLSDGPLPWTCETKYEWKDMGSDHYPRFVRTAECKTRLCFNGFFRCKPRRYKTKVLRRVTGTEAVSCEDDDASLPESLRNNWKFITVTINLCCDCAGRFPVSEPPATT